MASLGMNWYLSWWLRIAFLIVSMGVSSNQVHSILPPFIAIIVCINFHTTWLSSVMCLSYQPWWGYRPVLLTLWHASHLLQRWWKVSPLHSQVWRGVKALKPLHLLTQHHTMNSADSKPPLISMYPCSQKDKLSVGDIYVVCSIL